jgi:hypothetical protein
MEAAEWFIPKLQINLAELMKAAEIHIFLIPIKVKAISV